MTDSKPTEPEGAAPQNAAEAAPTPASSRAGSDAQPATNGHAAPEGRPAPMESEAPPEAPRSDASRSEAPKSDVSRTPSGTPRAFERFPVGVTVDFVSEHNFFTGFSVNVSEGGLFVATHVYRPVGAKLSIRLALPDVEDPLDLLAEVRWVREHRADSEHSPGLGLRFVNLSPLAEERIATFMKKVRDPLFYDLE